MKGFVTDFVKNRFQPAPAFASLSQAVIIHAVHLAHRNQRSQNGNLSGNRSENQRIAEASLRDQGSRAGSGNRRYPQENRRIWLDRRRSRFWQQGGTRQENRAQSTRALSRQRWQYLDGPRQAPRLADPGAGLRKIDRRLPGAINAASAGTPCGVTTPATRGPGHSGPARGNKKPGQTGPGFPLLPQSQIRTQTPADSSTASARSPRTSGPDRDAPASPAGAVPMPGPHSTRQYRRGGARRFHTGSACRWRADTPPPPRARCNRGRFPD